MTEKFLKHISSRVLRNEPSNRVQPAAYHGEIERERGGVTPIRAIIEIIPRSRRAIGTRNRTKPLDSRSSCRSHVQPLPKTRDKREPAQVIPGDFRIRKFRLTMFVQPSGYCACVPS